MLNGVYKCVQCGGIWPTALSYHVRKRENFYYWNFVCFFSQEKIHCKKKEIAISNCMWKSENEFRKSWKHFVLFLFLYFKVSTDGKPTWFAKFHGSFKWNFIWLVWCEAENLTISIKVFTKFRCLYFNSFSCFCSVKFIAVFCTYPSAWCSQRLSDISTELNDGIFPRKR